MYGYIYKTTNLINNHIYIGQKKGNYNPNYLGSGIYLHNAIKAYGKENFTNVIIDYCYSQEDMNNKEKFWIEFERTFNYCYNISDGGQEVTITNRKEYSNEWYEKVSNSIKSNKEFIEHNIEQCKWLKEHNSNAFWVTNGIDEIFLLKDDPIPDGYYKGRVKNYFPDQTGIPKSKELLDKMSNTKKSQELKWWTNGTTEVYQKECPGEGYKLGRTYIPKCAFGKGDSNIAKDPEIRRKNSEAHKGFNWYTNGVQSHQYKPGTEPEGWYRGRTIKRQ